MRHSDVRSKHRNYVPVVNTPHVHCNCEGCGRILRVTLAYLKKRGIAVPTTAVIPGVRCGMCQSRGVAA